MNDFAMCSNPRCPSKELCLRHTATPDPKQWVIYFIYVPDDLKCDCFIPNERATTREKLGFGQ